MKLYFSLGGLAGLIAIYSQFLKWIELRPGLVLPDPVLAGLPVVDLTWPIFILIYGPLFYVIGVLFRHREQLMIAIWSYSLLFVARMMVMTLLPLDPPLGMITLQDPLAQFFGSSAQPLTRDLFFSGHTATLFLTSLLVPQPKARVLIQILTPILAVMLLIQHVHYSIDVVCAPFFAYGCYRLARWALSLTRRVPTRGPGSVPSPHK